jgi:hypothetical protein
MKKILYLLIILFSINEINAQQGIGVTNPNASAAWEINSTTKGILLPRLTTAQMTAIASPAAGLMIYNTDLNCIHYYNVGWKSQCDPANLGAWSLLGNAGTTDGTNFIGTTNNVPFNIRVNNQKAGRVDATGVTTLGYQAGNLNTAAELTAFGRQAGASNITGTNNTFYGYRSGYLNTASNNTFLGHNSGAANTTGQTNTAVGMGALVANTTGGSNTTLGANAMAANTTGSLNVAIGNEALFTNNGASNTAVGYESAKLNSTGARNTALGNSSLHDNTTGADNVALGMSAGYKGTTLDKTVFVGAYAGYNATGNNAIGVGYQAGYNTTSGGNNTFVGYQAGLINTMGANNTFLGYQADVTSATLTNATAIGYNAKVAASNSIVLGGTGASSVNIGLGITAPAYKLDINSASNPLRMSGLQLGSTADSVLTVSSAVVKRMKFSDMVAGNAWGLLGNTGTNASTNFVGTTDMQDLVFRTNNTEIARIQNSTKHFGVGTSNPEYRIMAMDPSGSDGDICARVYNNNTYNGLAGLLLQSSAGNYTTPSPLLNTMPLGALRFGGYDGVSFNDVHCAEVSGYTSENWTSSAHGTTMLFKTIPNGTIITQTRMILDQAGNLSIGTATPNTKLDIDGAIALRPTANTVTADNQAITVGNRSFLRLTPDAVPASRTITLSNGLQDGQQLVIRVSATGANGIELADSGNLNLSGTAMLDDGDTLTLIWDGTLWFEMYRSSN